MAGEANHDAGQHGNDADEWRVAVPDTDGATAGGEHENVKRRRCGLSFSWIAAARDRAAGFARMVWKIGADDPRKAVHGLKVALALTLCSVFYYVRPLYDFTGESAMWAVLTVVVVFEYTVGGCLYKGINRAMATFSGGALALGVQWVASKSSKELEPYILAASLFVFAGAATYSRFIPTMKARFDYGVTIFILTYTLVAVSGYRADEILSLAQNRLTTIAIGAVICFAVCALVVPVWAGQELHDQVARNMDKLAAAVEACVVDGYFSSSSSSSEEEEEEETHQAVMMGYYKAVLNAKASEDSLANLATWEPAHGNFGFRHPYKMYQKIGAAMRSCAYSVDALAACASAKKIQQAPPASVKNNLASSCAVLSRHCAVLLREASGSLASMTTRSARLALLVDDMNKAARDMREELMRLAVALEEEEEQSTAAAPQILEVLPLFTATSLLLEICARAEGVVAAVDALATTARFKKADDDHEMENTVDLEAGVAVPIAITTSLTEDATQETRAKAAAADQVKMTTGHVSDQAPRDQVGELINVLMRRRSSKKRARGEPKVCPQPPLLDDFTVHAPSPTSRSMELTTAHAHVVPSPKSWSMDLTAHPHDFKVHAPSPRHRNTAVVELAAGHPPVAPSPRNRSVDFVGHPPIAPSPRNRSVDVAGHGPVVVLASPRNRSMDFATHGPVLPSPRHRSILGVA
ncbi:hypothetical protein PR202_gb22955 [Eleusine coracana subsp. coracana]|uniref:Aluminum-activated malate transporter n=1 Tax=Eleusine coracana subsp. coracana TaxID=191504 RepID=A0AAV5FJ75_ELECO|nr:hypothetical protein QOZ80_6BG0484450 [Eleusine coracana subsp. coracana]GJN34306.1 hypothetical protein PR202_gb22955 [Eleusine coracana subsp. coracana]